MELVGSLGSRYPKRRTVNWTDVKADFWKKKPFSKYNSMKKLRPYLYLWYESDIYGVGGIIRIYRMLKAIFKHINLHNLHNYNVIIYMSFKESFKHAIWWKVLFSENRRSKGIINL